MGWKRDEWQFQALDSLRELGALEDETTAALVTAWLASGGEDAELDRLVRDRLKECTLSAFLDECVFNLPLIDCDGPIHVGDALEVGVPVRVGLRLVDFTQMVLVVGTHGSGKTALLRYLTCQLLDQYAWPVVGDGVSLVILDSKLDSVGLYRTYPRLLVLRWQWLRFNPLEVPAGVDPHEWRNMFVDMFCGVFTIGDVGSSLLLQAVDYLYDRFGVYSGKFSFPTLRQLLGLLREWQSKPDSSRKREAFSSLENRLLGLLTVWGGGLDCSRGMCVPALLAGSVVLALNELSSQHLAFLTSLLFLWTFTYAKSNNLRGDKLRLLFMVDEAEPTFGRDVRLALGKTPVLFQILPREREFGMGLVLATQVARGLDDRGVLSLARTKVVKNTSDYNDAFLIGSSLGWKKEQVDYCRRMRVGEAAVSIGDRQPDSVLVSVPYVPLDKSVDWDEVWRVMGPRIGSVFSIVPPVPFPKVPSAVPVVSQDSVELKRVLMDVLNHPFVSKTDRLARLFGSSVSKCQRIANACVSDVYVKEFKVHVGGRSGLVVLWQLTQKGYDLLGLPSRPLRGIGDLVHQYLQYRVLEAVKAWGLRGEIEMLRCGKRVDVGVEDGTDLFAVEIATTSRNEASNVRKDLAAGFSLVAVLVTTSSVRKSVEALFARELSSDQLSWVRVFSIDSFLNSSSFPLVP